jgi:hypothetical protein
MIEGWGGYKFGMTPDQARAVPGQKFGAYSPKNIWGESKGAMGATTHPVINGVSYDFNLYFDGATGRLNGGNLANEKTNALSECNQVFLTLLEQQAKAYGGGFNPVNPQRKRLESDTPPMSLEWKQEGGSRYELATLTYADEYAYAWKARKGDGVHYVEVYATWSAHPDVKTSPCVSGISFAFK